MEINKGDLFPGQRISVDHYVRDVPGRIYKYRGGSEGKDMSCGGMVFTNHIRRYILTGNQVNISAG